MKAPENYQYTTEHMWVQTAGDNIWLAGITDYAQDLLGDVIFIEPPAIGSQLLAGHSCGIIESVKTGADLFAPLDGEVVAINVDLVNAPEQIQEAPYAAWIIKIKTAENVELSHLLNAAAYKAMLNE